MRRAFGALVAAGAVLAAGCGGGGAGGGVPAATAKLPAGASVAPRSAALFLAIDTSFHSRQWRRSVALFRRFPGSAELLRMLRRSSNASLALGPESDLVFLDYGRNGGDLVGLTRPRSKAKLVALLARGGGPRPVTRELHGWTLVAQSRRLLDRFERDSKRGVLAGDDAFKDAMGRLDQPAAVRLYAAGAPIQQAIDRGILRAGGPRQLSEEVGTLVATGAYASAEANGVRFGGLVRVEDAVRPNAYTAQLPDDAPAGALLYVSFNHLDLALKKILKVVAQHNSRLEEQLSQLEAVTDITLSHDIYPLLAHEGAVAVYPGAPIPTVVFLLRLKDEARAKQVLSKAMTIVDLGGGSNVKTNSYVVRGVQIDEVDASGTRIFLAVFHDEFAATNDKATMLRLIAGSVTKLSADPAFTRLQRDAAMPQRTLGFVYANLQAGLPAAFRLARRSGSAVTPAERANTKPLRSALLYATRDGDRYALTGFVTIK
jgi:hypothetical protein